MKVHLSLQLKQNHSGKILHITDTHLFANDDCCLLGVNTNASFYAVIDEVKQAKEQFDLIVVSGDIVQDGSEASYLKFAEAINQLSIPCVWLPGNHDVYVNMEKVFNQQNLAQNKVVLFGDKWVIILLNSQVEGQAFGLLSSEELTFLSSTLANNSDRYALIFLHHHPIMSGSAWLDQHCLKNHLELAEVIKQYPNTKAIGWGHIHQNIEKNWHHCHVFSTPSTCVQFKPLSEDFCVANDSPGWRIIDLDINGTIKTLVHCLKNSLFLPDMSLSGY